MLFYHWLNSSTKCVSETQVSQTILLFFQKRCSLHSVLSLHPLISSHCWSAHMVPCERTLVWCVHSTTLHLHNTELPLCFLHKLCWSFTLLFTAFLCPFRVFSFDLWASQHLALDIWACQSIIDSKRGDHVLAVL